MLGWCKQQTFKAWNHLRWLGERLPLTWQGFFLLLAGTAFVYYYGLKHRDWILLSVGIFALLLLGINIIAVGLSALSLYRRTRSLNERAERQPIQTETERFTRSGFVLPQPFLPFLDFSTYWTHPKAEVTLVNHFPSSLEEVKFERRGSFERIDRVMVLQDLFGLAQIQWKMSEDLSIQILPRSQSNQVPITRASIDGDGRFVPSRPRTGDRVDTRAYQPGDPVRYIHWKLFAKKRIPIVRIQEPSATYDRQMIAYLVCDPFDEKAAELARWSVEHGALGDTWRFGADGGGMIASEMMQARKILAVSGEAHDRCGRELQSFLEEVHFDAHEHRLMFFVSPQLEAWKEHLFPILSRYAGSTTLVIAGEDNSISKARPKHTLGSTDLRPLWKRLLLDQKIIQTITKEASWEALQRFTQDGLQIHLAHHQHISKKRVVPTQKANLPSTVMPSKNRMRAEAVKNNPPPNFPGSFKAPEEHPFSNRKTKGVASTIPPFSGDKR